MSYELDTVNLTVIATDEHGESYDLNATGEPCRSIEDLHAFARELSAQGAFDATVLDELLAQS